MSASKGLLPDLQKLVIRLRDDLRECLDGKTDEPADRKQQLAAAGLRIQAEYDATKDAERTAQSFTAWREDYLTQVAVAWVLACVFVRFLEDNGFVADCRLAGPDDTKRHEAQSRHAAYFREHKTATDRDYLLEVFKATAQIPAARDLFAEGATPLWVVGPSGDTATALVNFWHGRDSDGELRSFARPDGDTRFLGDLYQDLSEDARKKYALLQTPVFVEEFILDRTLGPACAEFGFQNVTLIDPTCGSGHFLLGAFDRLMHKWAANGNYTQLTGHEWNPIDAAGRVFAQVHGVDVNPYAVAIARFRLLIAACRWCNVTRLANAPGWQPRVFCGDSLFHGKRWGVVTNEVTTHTPSFDPSWDDRYHLENVGDVTKLLSKKYHAVVGNPPYITVKDAALSRKYRERYPVSCYRAYSLGVPFTERFWDLCLAPENGPAGFVGLITTNSFMKREFGKKLIEDFFPRVDLTHVIDTSGAYIPGHGTPTVILFGRNRPPVVDSVRAVLGIKGEPKTPDDPSHGLVWSSIVENVDVVGAQTEFVSAADMARETFAKHPWSIGGGGAAELKEAIEDSCDQRLGTLNCDIGFLVITGEDNCLVLEGDLPARLKLLHVMPFVLGDAIRDWQLDSNLVCLWPYDKLGKRLDIELLREHLRFCWSFRTVLRNRKAFGVPVERKGIPWWALREVYGDRLRTPLTITFAFVASHNHFLLDRGGKVFNRSAPIIKLPVEATEDQHLELVGLLNSSTACFWMKQTFHNKGGQGINEGLRGEHWEMFYEHTGTGLERFPIPESKPLALAHELDKLGQQIVRLLPDVISQADPPTVGRLAEVRSAAESIRGQMISLQEELDWHSYELYGLLSDDLRYIGDDLPRLAFGERAFEIVMARQSAAGQFVTTWFDRHSSTPSIELPSHWPAEYRTLVERRLSAIENNVNIHLIERPEYKRRWSSEPWEDMEERSLRDWLLNRLEGYCSSSLREIAFYSCAKIADVAKSDDDFQQVGAIYRDDPVFDVLELVAELVMAEAVPFLPVLRYKESGLRKRGVWEQTWDLQRGEDAGENVGTIPVPPKYVSADFVKTDYWRLRGKLDVPKERWVSYPHCERDGDPTLVVSCAGYDHLQQARALSAYYVTMKDNQGWTPERLTPLLAGLDQLVPWLVQWHNDFDPDMQARAGDAFAAFVNNEAAALGTSLDAIRGWMPPKKATRSRTRKKKEE